MKHKQKKKMARKMMTKKEIKNHCPIFQSEAWEKRKKQIAIKQAKKVLRVAKIK